MIEYSHVALYWHNLDQFSLNNQAREDTLLAYLRICSSKILCSVSLAYAWFNPPFTRLG